MSVPTIKVSVWGSAPEYKSALAAGADLRAYLNEPILIKPFERILVPTNTYIALPQGYEGQVRPRSGLSFEHGITLINAVGTIDADYRGEIHIPLINMSNTAYTIEHGQRIAQLVITKCERATFMITECFDDLPACDKVRSRFTNGFGSTGKL